MLKVIYEKNCTNIIVNDEKLTILLIRQSTDKDVPSHYHYSTVLEVSTKAIMSESGDKGVYVLQSTYIEKS